MGSRTDRLPELIQFPYSHFNEKARWALDWKRIPHRRTSLLPGPHALRVRRLTGATQVPVLRWQDRTIAGSARILAALDAERPERPLLPEDPALRSRALEIQHWFDEEVGPLVRRALFAALLQTPGYLCRLFASERSAPVRALYLASFPLARGRMRAGMGIGGAAALEEGLAGTAAGLDFVARHAGPGGALVGGSFGTADLTAAALLAPAVLPEGSPMALPHPRPPALEAWGARWARHPGADWVRETYARHRPPSAAVVAPA